MEVFGHIDHAVLIGEFPVQRQIPDLVRPVQEFGLAGDPRHIVLHCLRRNGCKKMLQSGLVLRIFRKHDVGKIRPVNQLIELLCGKPQISYAYFG